MRAATTASSGSVARSAEPRPVHVLTPAASPPASHSARPSIGISQVASARPTPVGRAIVMSRDMRHMWSAGLLGPRLAAPGAQHPGAEALPGARAVQGVVPAAVGLAGVFRAAATGPARDDTADRAELHSSGRFSVASRLTLVTLDCTPFDIATSLSGGGIAVYPPAVLHLQDQSRPRPGVARASNRMTARRFSAAPPRPSKFRQDPSGR